MSWRVWLTPKQEPTRGSSSPSFAAMTTNPARLNNCRLGSSGLLLCGLQYGHTIWSVIEIPVFMRLYPPALADALSAITKRGKRGTARGCLRWSSMGPICPATPAPTRSRVGTHARSSRPSAHSLEPLTSGLQHPVPLPAAASKIQGK